MLSFKQFIKLSEEISPMKGPRKGSSDKDFLKSKKQKQAEKEKDKKAGIIWPEENKEK